VLALSVLVLVFASLALTSAAFAYSGAAAAAYADTYWQTYNPAWPSFANSGGDCTNFVSQALYAGGIGMRTSPTYSGHAAWYMVKKRNRWSYAAPWVNAQDQSIFLLQHLSGTSQVASYYGLAPGATAADHAEQGDVVLYDWNNDGVYDHEAILIASDGTNPDGTTNWDLVDGHTNNRYHAYWTLAQLALYWASVQ